MFPNTKGSGFFLSERGTRLIDWNVQGAFRKFREQVGLRGEDDRRGPRLHDFRHSLAVTRSCAGIVTASMSGDTCPSYQPILAMETLAPHIGTLDSNSGTAALCSAPC